MTLSEFDLPDMQDEYYSVMSVQLGELIDNDLFDWENDETLVWDYYSEAQYTSVCTKFCERFYYRDIGILPYGQWRKEYVRLMNEIMPKYKILYAAIDEGQDILADSDTYGKERIIDSDFPATMLGDNQDFASYGKDREFETIVRGDFIGKTESIVKRYNDIDVLILNELETLFSSLFTVNINGF